MKKFFALGLALSLCFSSTVCAETVVPPKDFPRLDTLSEDVDKELPEFTSNAVAKMDGVDNIAKIASGSDMITEGKETNATCVVDKASVAAIRYAQQKASQVGGSMVAVAELSAPGVHLENAQVKLCIEGIKAGDAVSAYRCVGGEWVAVSVVAVADDHVTISFPDKGIYTIIK